MEKIIAFFYDINYFFEFGIPVIVMHGRTNKGNSIVLEDRSFKPYFIVEISDDSDIDSAIEEISSFKVDKDSFVISAEAVKLNIGISDKSFIKVFVNAPSAVRIVKDFVKLNLKSYKKSYEKDIPFVRRYLIDKNLCPLTFYEFSGTLKHINDTDFLDLSSFSEIEDYGSDPYVNVDSSLNAVALDIETYFNSQKPDDMKIISVSLFSDSVKKVFMLKNDKSKLDYAVFCSDERNLLVRLKNEIKKISPDIIFGYNSDNFDFHVIDQRCKALNVKFDIGVNSSNLKIRNGSMRNVSIPGIMHIDLYRFVRTVVARTMNFESLTLDDVALNLLGENKVDLDYEDMFKFYDKGINLDLIAKYNLKDSEITYNLGMKLLPQILELSRLVGIVPFDVSRLSFSQFVEWYLIRLAVADNRLILNRPGREELNKRIHERFEGAFVFKPSPGLYENIVIFDFKSLYPTIIATHNISPETFDVPCDDENKIFVPEDNKDWFIKEPIGFISKSIKRIIDARSDVKREMKKTKDSSVYRILYARQLSLKTVANSMYGYLGFEMSRWYCLGCARSVTAFGRHHIKTVISDAQKEGFKVIYSDTDSVFISLGKNKSKSEALEFLDKVNKNLPGIMELENEGFYPKGIFVSSKMGHSGAKKKYVLVDSEGSLVIKGFETIRRNWSRLGKDVQRNVFNIILVESDPKKAFDYVRKVVSDLYNGKISMDSLVITTKLQKNLSDYDAIGPHVAAAMRMRDLGMKVVPGTVISYIVTKGKGPLRSRVSLKSEYKEGSYDADYYVKNQILTVVEKIFEVLGFSSDSLVKGSNQKSLESFFS